MSAAAIICRRGSFLLQLRCSSSLSNRSYSSLLPDYATLIPSSSSISSPLGLSNNLYRNRRGQILYISQFVKAKGNRTFLVDTLALVRRLEAQGVPTKQAEAITSAITEVLNDSLENVAHSFCTKQEMEKNDITQDAIISKFKSEVQSSQEHHFTLLQRETEKLRVDVDKMRSDLRHEIDKVTAGQRLDLNLERGRTRDELAKQISETSALSNKLDKEIHGLRAQLEAAKFDLIKYGIGAYLSLTAVGLGVYRSFFQK